MKSIISHWKEELGIAVQAAHSMTIKKSSQKVNLFSRQLQDVIDFVVERRTLMLIIQQLI